MVSHEQQVAGALREHLVVCDDLLRLALQESEALRGVAQVPTARIQDERKTLLARLESSSQLVIARRNQWREMKPPGADPSPELEELVRTTLDRIMRVLVIDRENEQNLLRRGLLPPCALPRPERSQPSFVARAYERHAHE